jgi:dienelactone hydrolase
MRLFAPVMLDKSPLSAMVDRALPWLRRKSLLLSLSLVVGLYGSPVDAARMAQTTPLAPPPERPVRPDLADFPLVRAYDLGVANLDQRALTPEFPTMPVPLTGGIAVPEGDGPFPWVIVLHGRHAGCHLQGSTAASQWPCPPESETRYDLGFAYLAQGLAEAGYGVLMVNLNGAFSDTYGADSEDGNRFIEQRSVQIIDAHLQRLAVAHRGEEAGFGIPLEGKVDLKRLALVGHSMGGGMAAFSARQRMENDSPAQVQAGLGPFTSLLLLSPTPSESIAQRPDAYQLPDIPTSVVMGACDRDIFDFSSLFYFETAAQNASRRTPAATVLVLGGNHNFFNSTVPKDDYYRRPDNAPLCDPQRSPHRLSRVDQETFLLAYLRDFLTLTLSRSAVDQPLAALGLLTQRAAPARLYTLPVLTNLALPPAARQPIFNAAELATVPASRPAIKAEGITMERCVALRPCDHLSRSRPQFPTVLALRWTQPGGKVMFSVPRQETLDVSALDSLQLRLTQEPDNGNNKSTALAVVLRDQTGQAVRVEIPPTTPALHTPTPDPTHAYAAGPVYPSSLRIPLLQFRGVDLTAITSIELVFDQTAPGAIYLASLEFIGQSPAVSWRSAPATAAGEF